MPGITRFVVWIKTNLYRISLCKLFNTMDGYQFAQHQENTNLPYSRSVAGDRESLLPQRLVVKILKPYRLIIGMKRRALAWRKAPKEVYPVSAFRYHGSAIVFCAKSPAYPHQRMSLHLDGQPEIHLFISINSDNRTQHTKPSWA